MPAGEIYQASCVFTGGDAVWANVLYIEVVDDTGTTDAEKDAIDALSNQVIAKMRDLMSFQTNFDCVLSRRVAPTTGSSRVFDYGQAGTVIQPMSPSNVAVNLMTRSKPSNIGNRGRIFIGGIPSSWIDDGRLLQTNFVTFSPFRLSLTQLQTDAGRTYQMKHYSPKLATFEDIFDTTIRPVPTKLRNRTQSLCPIS